MNTVSPARESAFGTRCTSSPSDLVELTAERDVGKAIALTVVLCFIIGGMLGSRWWLAPAAAIIVWGAWLLGQTVFIHLREPSVWVTSGSCQPGQEVLVQCDLRAKSEATLDRVVVEFESDESRGEDTHTERYEEWRFHWSGGVICSEKTTLREYVRVPTFCRRQWSGSSVEWYLKLSVQLANGTTLRRRYPIEVVGCG